MIYHMKCAVCGKEFIAGSKSALYCSYSCKQKAQYERAKQIQEEAKKAKLARLEMMRLAQQAPSRKCRGCVWKSWQDHKKCVMPKCLCGVGRADGTGTETAVQMGELREDLL